MSDLRQILHSAYTFVRSQETNTSFAALTLDHLISERIARLKQGEETTIVDARGKNLGSRSSRYDLLSDLEKKLDDVVQAIQDAGDDPDKLAALGIGLLDEPTVNEDL